MKVTIFLNCRLWASLMEVSRETRHVQYIIYLLLIFFHRVETSVGGLLDPEGIIDTVAYAAAQTTDIVS